MKPFTLSCICALFLSIPAVAQQREQKPMRVPFAPPSPYEQDYKIGLSVKERAANELAKQDLQAQLQRSFQEGDVNAVRELLSKHPGLANENVKTKEQRSTMPSEPLVCRAIRKGQLDMVKAFVEGGFHRKDITCAQTGFVTNPNLQELALLAAVDTKDEKVARYWLSKFKYPVRFSFYTVEKLQDHVKDLSANLIAAIPVEGVSEQDWKQKVQYAQEHQDSFLAHFIFYWLPLNSSYVAQDALQDVEYSFQDYLADVRPANTDKQWADYHALKRHMKQHISLLQKEER